MAPVTRRLLLSNQLFERIKTLKKGVGFVYGFAADDSFEALGIALCRTETIEKKLATDGSAVNIESELSECLSYSQSSLPAGVGIIGNVLVHANDSLLSDALDHASSVFTSDNVYSTETPVLIVYNTAEENFSVSVIDEHQEAIEASYDIVPMLELMQPYLIVRLKAQLKFNTENSSESIKEEFAEQLKKASSGVYTFYFKQSHVYIKSNDEDGIAGIYAEKQVENLLGKRGDGKKKKKTALLTEMEVLEADLLKKPAKLICPGEKDPVSNCAPVIQHKKKEYENVCIPMRINGLCLIRRDSSLCALYDVLVEVMKRQLVAAEACILSELSSTSKISPPQPLHFLSDIFGHFITLFYPKEVSDSDLVSLRERRHEVYALPKDRPYFRRGCKHVFREDMLPNSPLINPHMGLTPAGLKDPEIGVVQGRYSYHHYMQDNFDDNGWGCAYRSLQTVVSWFRWQGYTEVSVPSHKAIQQCLVDIGDKPAPFLGSRQWIGSTEVSFCLESLLGITSRIMAVSSGEELCSRGDELLRHFNTHGTPIMIGGGVLAHTILGVALQQDTGDIRFLILDPHYTGGEDLGIIQSKGWCGWKGPDFWIKSAFYNLCMPQRPTCL